MNKNLLVAIALIAAISSLHAQEAMRPAHRVTSKKKTRVSADARTKAREDQAKAEMAARKLREPFWKRFDEAMLEQLGTGAYTPPESGATPAPSTRRIPPAPFDSPPFPNGDWQIGGSTIIGDPGELPPYPLMQAIYDGPDGPSVKESKVQMYGWVNFSGNISSSHPSKTSQNGNFPLIYDLRPNRLELNQLVLYLERLPDENQTDHVDWGFRISALYGLDYRFTTTYGFLSDQLLKHNSYSGLDMPMIYLDLYVPNIFDGMNIRIGRIISEPDIEAQLGLTTSWRATRSSTVLMIIVRKESLLPRSSTTSGPSRPAFQMAPTSPSGKRIPGGR